MLNGLDLFSGIGGITLALGEWIRPVAYCECDPYATSVLFSRFVDGTLPKAPIFPDVRNIRGNILPSIDILYGGFPCQDISNAGLREGLEGERSGLFFEIVRLARELRPRFVFLENVSAITVRGLEAVITEWTALGYDTRWTCLSAAAVGARHIRERWWLLAHSNGASGRDELREQSDTASDAPNNGKSGHSSESRTWSFEPEICRAANGLPFRLDRLKGLGNSVVPQCAKEAFERLMGMG